MSDKFISTVRATGLKLNKNDNNKVNKVKLANCDNESYGFPVEEIDYKNIDKEMLTTNNKDSPNEQTAGQSRARVA